MLSEPISAIFSASYFSLEDKLRSVENAEELVQAFSSSLGELFLIEGAGLLIARKAGRKLIKERMLGSPYSSSADDLSKIQDELLDKIQSILLLSSESSSKASYRVKVRGRDYRAHVVVNCSEATHVLFFLNPTGLESTKDLDATVGLFEHEWQWFDKLERANRLNFLDDLTGLYNYRFLEDALNKEIARCSRYEEVFSMLFVDLDNFKSVNDSHGHVVGSKFLKGVSSELILAVREVDFVIRYGGDEFVIILLNAGQGEAEIVAERVRERVESYQMMLDKSGCVQTTASIGISSYPDDGVTTQSILNVADRNMYLVKDAGKNHFMSSQVREHGI